jgi:hypothetical protein
LDRRSLANHTLGLEQGDDLCFYLLDLGGCLLEEFQGLLLLQAVPK